MSVIEFLQEASRGNSEEYHPRLFNLSQLADRDALEALRVENKILTVQDDYEEQLRELFQINNSAVANKPECEGLFQEYLNSLGGSGQLWSRGRWVYLPWRGLISHVLVDEDFQKVRTARNKYLIDNEEQEKFYNCTVGIAGLSIGNTIALAIVMQGGARHIKLADHDTLALSNINRIRAGVESFGVKKVIMTAREIYSINPYAEVEIFTDGLTPKNIDEFFGGDKPLNVVIDEIDNLALKYLIREQAKKRKIPIAMGADNADSAVVDLERHDTSDDVEFFHGRMGEVSYESLKQLDKFGIGKMITKYVGVENVNEKMQRSLLEMGKTVVSWPQLGGAALLNGAAVAYCVRKLSSGQQIESDRAIISLDASLDPSYESEESKAKRSLASETFRKIFGL